ncbi:MAG: 50S ribosomal protein L35 [Alphaproteobacteria bacterium]
MSKLKTRRAAAKRFSFTGTGKIKRGRAFHRHNFTDCQSKTAKVRGRKPAYLKPGDAELVKKMLPYG